MRKLAKDLGIDLAAVTATRAGRRDQPGGYRERRLRQRGPPRGPATGAAYDPATRERRIPVKGIRKATAAAMVASAFTAPHVTEFLTVDVTPMMELRDRLRERPEFADVKLTPAGLRGRAVCLAARRTPEINCGRADEAAPTRSSSSSTCNLGIAAATPRGLIVPGDPGRRRARSGRPGAALQRADRDGPRRPDHARAR